MKLGRDFFENASFDVARELLGCFVVHTTASGKIVGRIVETEAYGDSTDLASHARFGPTQRTKIMFGPAGHLYVYSIYGIFNLTNIICGPDGHPSAVLIRATEIIEGQEAAKTNVSNSKFAKANDKIATGPGKLSLALGIDRSHNGIDITNSDEIYILPRTATDKFDVVSTARIGIEYSKHSKELPWRFYIRNNKFVSKK
ncbi:MAG: DNA-3-methyladenine glycosylase [Patescibacteria group bacterium]|jgi:DNA-3-methyladenine glycosylase